MPPSEYRQCC